MPQVIDLTDPGLEAGTPATRAICQSGFLLPFANDTFINCVDIESTLFQDLNGDGDFNDEVLSVLLLPEQTLVPLGLAIVDTTALAAGASSRRPGAMC